MKIKTYYDGIKYTREALEKLMKMGPIIEHDIKNGCCPYCTDTEIFIEKIETSTGIEVKHTCRLCCNRWVISRNDETGEIAIIELPRE